MELDLHALGVRVMYLYSKHDGNFRDTKLMDVDFSGEIPESGQLGSRVPALLSTTLKTTLYKLERTAPFEMSEETFFGPGVKPDDVKTQEDYFWTVNLQYSCTTLTVAMKKVVDLIGSGNFFAWFSDTDGIKKTYLDPSAVEILKVFFVPRELNVTVTSYPIFPGVKDRVLTTEVYLPGQKAATHECLLLQSKFVVDPSAMQFGHHRGAQKELVGHTLSFYDYIGRFKGNVLYTRPRTEEDMFAQYHFTDELIDKIVDHVMADLRDGKKWCSYCGKSHDKLSRCSRCKSVWYCDGYCQKSDWAGHKPICAVQMDLNSIPLPVAEDDGPDIEAI